MSRAIRASVICLLVVLHLGLDVILLVGDWRHYVWAWEWPTSQCSLVALWAAMSRRGVGFRAAVACLGTMAAWLLHSRVEGVLQEHRSFALLYAVGYFVHSLTIIVLIRLYKYAARLIRRRVLADEAHDTQPLQFSLRSVLAWTAIVAIGLGVGSTAFARVELPPNFFSRWLPRECLSAVLWAGIAVLLLWSFVGPSRWVFPKVMLGLAMIGCGVYLSRYLFGLFDPIYLFPSVVEVVWVSAGYYVGCLCLTLVPLRLGGYFGVQKRDLHTAPSRADRDNPSIS